MGMWSLGLGAVGAAIAGILLANTDMCLPKVAKASVDHLADADLHSTTDGEMILIKAGALWEKSGAVVMAEAAELSSLKPLLEERGVPLVAVVKEDIGTEIQDFRPHFAGDIYIDEQHFYGPLQRRMGGLGFIRLGVWQNFVRAWRSGYEGNMNGEGFILGECLSLGQGIRYGILLEHREKEFGDKVDIGDVLEAVKLIVPEQ
uniref:Peroxiredoxin-like 2A n=1 Tax=Neogobius melanostomus TaxID=47308 RepID=A0A8C6UT52_9GOBI